jgi:hypothetical protein
MIDYKHTLDIIKNTDLSSHPYSHIQCDNVFSNSVYEKILENRIETDCLQTLNELGRVGNGYSNKRKVLGLGKKLTILPENQRLFWEPFSEWLLTDFKKTIIEKFNITDNCHVDILYSRDFKGYQLGPHTDSTKKLKVSRRTINRWLNFGKSNYKREKETTVNGIKFHSRIQAAKYFNVHIETIRYWLKKENL